MYSERMNLHNISPSSYTASSSYLHSIYTIYLYTQLYLRRVLRGCVLSIASPLPSYYIIHYSHSSPLLTSVLCLSSINHSPCLSVAETQNVLLHQSCVVLLLYDLLLFCCFLAYSLVVNVFVRLLILNILHNKQSAPKC